MFDPFAVFAEGGSEGLRTRLDALDLEGLRDIVAEHGMDSDRLAMKWKARDRVIGRIIDRVRPRGDPRVAEMGQKVDASAGGL